MYKTVRHGENSLQYTILPQTEEVLSNSGLKGKGRDYSPSIHVRRSKRRSAIKYLLLVVLGIIVALSFASVPLYVLNGALYARRSLHDQHELTTTSFNTAGREIIRSRKKELKSFTEAPTVKPTVEPSTAAPTTTTVASTTTTVNTGTSTTPWIIPSLRVWKVTTTSTTQRPTTEDVGRIPVVGTPSGSVRLLDHYMSMKPWESDIIIRPTVTPEPVTIRNIFRYYSRAFKPSERVPPTAGKVFEDVLITTKATTPRPVTENTRTNEVSKLKDLKDAILSVDDDDDFKESLEVDEVFSLPPLKPEGPSDADEVTVSKTTDGGWYGARWPFVDTSSYFQWTGYSPGDNLLLPLLVAALSSVALVLLLALAVRRRKRTSAAAQLGTAADMQVDDNTNLLTAENAEETEE
ncbi:uncharacterized protein LOC121734908 [Aricia agestis]|uniref:uncharacterized protein LOC121734908 n=1 Tax=Aricia agestis TaxID=91739 RepID=UPI001C205B04|nr:uncharacterized protein LOC121734908 [Aricia agestis]